MMDLATIVGLIIAFVAIIGGNALEGGHLSSILQPTAALIVFGGTIGAVAIQFPGHALRQTVRDIKLAFRPRQRGTAETVAQLVRLAGKARREGLVALEGDAAKISDPFLRNALELAVDGTDMSTITHILEGEIQSEEEQAETPVKVLEAAGGYAPTVGILGAVLGLIHVMENLSDPSRLGGGIAVAFVATVYGVGSANILFLPLAGKLKARARERVLDMELVLTAVSAIVAGESPRVVERKLSVYGQARAKGSSRDEAIGAAHRVPAIG